MGTRRADSSRAEPLPLHLLLLFSGALWGGQSWLQPPFRRPLRAGPAKLSGSGNQARGDGVAFNVSADTPEFDIGSDEVVVALILPEWCSAPPEYAVGFMGGEPFQRPQPFRGYDMRSHKHVDVIRHHYKGV